MNPIFAHHVEAQHVVVMISLFAAGSWLGWRMTSRLLGRIHGDSRHELFRG